MRRLRTGMAAGVVLAGITSTMPAAAQENKFALNAQAVSAYDSNALRRGSAQSDGPTDNASISPQLGIDYSRRFGRQRVYLAGTAGYVFNSRFSYLNRETINFSGGADVKVGARCQADPTFSLFRAQSDLEDLGDTIRNTVTVQDYSLGLSCSRAVGFSPKVSTAYAKTNNSGRRRQRNQDVYGGRAGLVYSRPSLGAIEAFIEYTHIERPNRLGINDLPLVDETEVTTYGLHYQRSAGTLLSFDASLGRTSVNPRSRLVPSFTGLTYAGEVSYRRSSRGAVRIGFNRSVTARNNLGTSYYVNRAVFAGINLKATSKISTGADILYGTRQFRGEDSTVGRFGPRGNDTGTTVSANASYRLHPRVSLALTGSYRNRNAKNDNYDYSSKQVTFTTSVRL